MDELLYFTNLAYGIRHAYSVNDNITMGKLMMIHKFTVDADLRVI